MIGCTATHNEVPLHVDDDSVATQLVEGSELAPHRHDILVIDDMEAVGHTPLELLSKRMVPWNQFRSQEERITLGGLCWDPSVCRK